MVAIVTTNVSKVATTTTSGAVGGDEMAVFGLMAVLTLVTFLIFKEVISSRDNPVLRRLSSMANIAVVPLLFAMAVTVLIRMAVVLG